jgi:predicted transcriptional regulator YdeE
VRFLCLLRYEVDPARPLPQAEADALIQEHIEVDHALQREGKLATAGALAPTSAARLVKVRDGRLSVTDGPFAETKEELGGFFVLQAKDLEEACQLAGRIPTARRGTVEVRPFRELFDDLHPPAPPRPPAPWPPTPRFEDVPELSLAAFGARYTPETMGRIPAQWGRFAAQEAEVEGARGPVTYGLCHAWREGSFEYACAIAAPPEGKLPPGWRRLALPAARYAIFPFEDHVSAMTRTNDWILNTRLPGSGRRAARGFAGGIELIERYGPGFDPESGYGDVELWLPLEG